MEEPIPAPPPEAKERVGSCVLLGAAGIGSAFALVGFLVGLRTIAATLLPYVLQPGDGINYQEILDGLPVPRQLDWNLSQIETLLDLRNMNAGLRLLLGALLFGGLWLAIISVLHPVFRVFGVTQKSSSSQPLALPLNTGQMGRAFLVLVLVGAPLAVVWWLTGFLEVHSIRLRMEHRTGPAEIGALLRWIALGAALWIGFRQGGLIDRFRVRTRRAAPVPSEDYSESLPATPPADRHPGLPRLAMVGACFGIGGYALQRCAMPEPSESLLERFHTLGTFNLDHFHKIATIYLGSVVAIWFACGLLLFLLGRPGLRRGQRGLLLIPVLALAGLALALPRPLSPAAMERRYDTTPAVLKAAYPYDPHLPASGVPDGEYAGQELAARTHIALASQVSSSERSVLFFLPRGVDILQQNGYTEDGLFADPASARKALDFLQRREFQSALSWTAIKHLFNVGTVHFDTTTAINACMLDMERCPHLAQCNITTRNMLFTCAASPQNIALVDRWADESHFAHPDRLSRLLIGQIYQRMGQKEKALAWFQRAEMPESYLNHVRMEPPVFHQGRIQGIFTLNGHPLAGVQVGVVPKRLNGLPAAMEPVVFAADREILFAPNYSPLFPANNRRPFLFRWISAGTLTDANGAFVLNDLTEGDYRLICVLPPGVHIDPQDPRLAIEPRPAGIGLSYTTPSADLGTIALTLRH